MPDAKPACTLPLALLGLACAAAALSAQTGELGGWRRSYYNLERSHIDHPFGKELIFEAQIAPQLIVTQTVHDLFAQGIVAADAEPHWGRSFSISPMVRLRMVNAASKPVRTPSFMPHGVFQIFRVKNVGSGEPGSAALRRGPYEMITFQARLSHHSNGQDGCLYTTQVKRAVGGDDFECDFQPGFSPDPDSLNLKDGSFTKNFLRAGGFYRRLNLPSGVDDVVSWSWYAGTTVEGHSFFPIDRLPGTIPEDQEELYGSWRLRLLGGLAWRADTGSWSGGHFFDVVALSTPDASEELPRWSLSAEFTRTFDRFGGWGAYVRLFTGRDYYNLGFGKKRTFFSLGVAWFQDSFEELGVM